MRARAGGVRLGHVEKRSGRQWRRGLVRAAASALCLWTLPQGSIALAEDRTAAALAVGCAHCHGPGGNSPGAVPSIAALDAGEIAGRLRAFRSGEREGTIMNRIARGYDDAEIDALAEYLAAQPGGETP